MSTLQATFTLRWRNAVKISCCLHLLLLPALGLAATGWLHSKPQPENLVEIELSSLDLATQSTVTATNFKQAEQRQAITTASAADTPVNKASTPQLADATATPLSSADGNIGRAAVASNTSGDSPVSPASGDSAQFTAASVGDVVAGGSSDNDRVAAIENFLARVEERKNYPYMALKRNLEGRPVIAVELAADGSLLAAAVAVSSGVASLDKAAVEAIRNACPFAHGLGESLAMSVPVSYQLGGR